MVNLVEKIRKVREEIDALSREEGAIKSKLREKKERLKSLEILTVNQIDMFDGLS